MPSESIPSRFTCDGDDVSPPLQWSRLPSGTREIALSVVDLDAPGGTFVHWLVFGIDPTSRGTDEGKVPPGAKQGTTSFGKQRYGGPCPPKGSSAHRYVFTLYALKVRTALQAGDRFDRFQSEVPANTIGSVSFTKSYRRG